MAQNPKSRWPRRRRERDGGPSEARRRRSSFLSRSGRTSSCASTPWPTSPAPPPPAPPSAASSPTAGSSAASGPCTPLQSSGSPTQTYTPPSIRLTAQPRKEARALEQAADFTFSFLPRGCGGAFRDARDGRVLLAQRISPDNEFYDFVVCDPLYRRYVKIPRMSEDLLASAAFNCMSNYVFPILAPAGENDEEESFRVIYSMQLYGKVVVFIFSSCNQTWRAIISTICLPGLIDTPYYAHGCLHWLLRCKHYSLVLDTREMEFSIIDLPPSSSPSKRDIVERAIVEAGEGRLGLVTVGDDTIDLYCKNWQNNGVGAQDWQHEKLIPLPEDYRVDCLWCIMGTAEHYVGLLVRLGMHLKYFVLDIKTLLLEELCTLKNGIVFYGFPYARFPPPLALPSI